MINYSYNEALGLNQTIILGLTGKTGSGCSKLKDVLEEIVAKELKVDNKVTFPFMEDRKKHIISKYFNKTIYAKYKISQIKYSEIIAEFIQNHGFITFEKYLDFLNIKSMVLNQKDYSEKIKELMSCFDNPKKLKNKIKELFLKLPINFSKKNPENLRLESNLYSYLFHNLSTYLRDKSINSKDNNTIDNQANPYAKIEFNIFEELNKKITNEINTNQKKIIIIDSLKNPLEIIYLKNKFINFYTIAIKREEENRRIQLQKKYTSKQINDLDKIESSNEFFSIKNLFTQNILKCIDLSDIHLYIKEMSAEEKFKWQIIKFITLIINPGVITPSNIEKCMNIAYSSKSNSGCIKNKVGAVVSDSNYNVKSIGYNSSPSFQVPCLLRDLDSLISECGDNSTFSEFERKNPDYLNYLKLSSFIHSNQESNIHSSQGSKLFFPYCFKQTYNKFNNNNNQIHTRSVHAEDMALDNDRINNGNDILFSTSTPCENCLKQAAIHNINTIYYLIPYFSETQKHILTNGVKQLNTKLFYGAIGDAYNKLYNSPINLIDLIKFNQGSPIAFTLKDYNGNYLEITSNDKLNKKESSFDDPKEITDKKVFIKVSEENSLKNNKFKFSLIPYKGKFLFKVDNSLIDNNFDHRKLYDDNNNCVNCGHKKTCTNCGLSDITDSKCSSCNAEIDNCIACGLNKHNFNSSEIYMTTNCNIKNYVTINRYQKYSWEKYEIRFICNDPKYINEKDKKIIQIYSLANDKYLTTSREYIQSSEDYPDDKCKFILEICNE